MVICNVRQNFVLDWSHAILTCAQFISSIINDAAGAAVKISLSCIDVDAVI